jgi:GNAT superfamily N-acetyltransferase
VSATVTLRTGTREDWPHVVNSFIVEYRKSPHGGDMSERLIAACIEALIKSPAWILTVMAPTDGGSEIYGWILWQNKAVAWLHVKEFWRGRGFARVLLNAANCNGGEVHTPFIAHRTSLAANFPMLAESKGWKIRHRPGLLLKEIIDG